MKTIILLILPFLLMDYSASCCTVNPQHLKTKLQDVQKFWKVIYCKKCDSYQQTVSWQSSRRQHSKLPFSKEASTFLKTAILCASTGIPQCTYLQLALTNTASFIKIENIKYVYHKVLYRLDRDLLVCLSLFTHYNKLGDL